MVAKGIYDDLLEELENLKKQHRHEKANMVPID